MVLETSWEQGFYIMQCKESSGAFLCYSALPVIIFILQFVSASHSPPEDGLSSLVGVKFNC